MYKLKKIFEHIRTWSKHKINNYYLSYKKWKTYLPLIRKDRQWDEAFLFRLLEAKFSLMEDYFRNHGISVSAERNALRIKICKNLCKRIAEQHYTNPYEERSKPHLDWLLERIRNETYHIPVGKRTIKINLDDPNKPDDRWILLGQKHEDYLEKQDIEFLCKILTKHVRGWWD